MDARTTSRCRCASPHRNNYSTAWQGISTSISNVVPYHVIRIFDVTSSGYLTSHLKNYTTPHCENYTSLQGKIAHRRDYSIPQGEHIQHRIEMLRQRMFDTAVRELYSSTLQELWGYCSSIWRYHNPLAVTCTHSRTRKLRSRKRWIFP